MTINLRLRDRHGLDGGGWYVPVEGSRSRPVVARALRLLAEARELEPGQDWHLEARGEVTGWHRADEADLGGVTLRVVAP